VKQVNPPCLMAGEISGLSARAGSNTLMVKKSRRSRKKLFMGPHGNKGGGVSLFDLFIRRKRDAPAPALTSPPIRARLGEQAEL